MVTKFVYLEPCVAVIRVVWRRRQGLRGRDRGRGCQPVVRLSSSVDVVVAAVDRVVEVVVLVEVLEHVLRVMGMLVMVVVVSGGGVGVKEGHCGRCCDHGVTALVKLEKKDLRCKK